MVKYFIAEIFWIAYEEGGRNKLPPTGTRYCPLLHFWGMSKNEEWSIDFICPNFEKTNVIKFKFLSEEAPDELIDINEFYNICEGNKKVARLKVIE